MRFIRQYLIKIPVSKKMNSDIVVLVDRLMELNAKLRDARVPGEREQLQRVIDHTEKKIDELVYQLYGLTDDEVRIVEESVG